MGKVKIEAFLSVPPCSGGINLQRLLKEIEEEFGEKVEISIYRGPHALFDKYNLSSAPAVVIEGFIKFVGLCPSKESLITALREAGME